MRVRFVHQAVLGMLLIYQFSVCLGKEAPDPNQSSKYLDAVRQFADNVLKYGRDTYGPKHTPLFVDGLNVNTHEPVKWINPDGYKWVLSNFASQQTLMRTLDGLSTITGDSKYKQAAMDAIKYAFENLRSPNGLLYWGHAAAYDAQADRVFSEDNWHSLKLTYPYYELMWEVDPNETERLINAYWSAHIINWSDLDMNRIARITKSLKEPWNYEYGNGPTFFTSKSKSVGFFIPGTSLAHAGTMLCKLSHQELPLVWSERLIHRYVATRHLKTGISAWVYNYRIDLSEFSDHFTDPYTNFFPLDSI